MNLRIQSILLVTLLFSHVVFSNTTWPKPNPDNCDFYLQLENVMKCSTKGVKYISDYAPFYCKKFMLESKSWNLKAQNWTKKTRQCLQETLYEKRHDPKLSCDNLEEMAFNTHSTCYNEADLCQLETAQMIDIFRIVKFKDYFKELRYADGGMIRLIKYCLKTRLF